MSYTIIVENKNTATGLKFYNIYTEKPGISGAGLQSMHSVVWHKTPGVPRNGKNMFTYTPKFYAFFGGSSDFSDQLAAGHTTYIISNTLANIAPTRDMGSQFLINGAHEIVEDGTKAPRGRFTVATESSFSEPNNYVVGVAREKVGGELTPIAVVDLKPSADYTFTPKPEVYVTCPGVALERGQVFVPPGIPAVATDTIPFAKIEFKDSRKTATVSEVNGAYSVVYS